MNIALDPKTIEDLKRDWYIGAIIVGHGPRQHVDLYRSRKEREESIFDAEHFGHKWREVKF